MIYAILFVVVVLCGGAGVFGIKAYRAARTQKLLAQARLALQQRLTKIERRLRDMEIKAMNTRLTADENKEFALLISQRNALISG